MRCGEVPAEKPVGDGHLACNRGKRHRPARRLSWTRSAGSAATPTDPPGPGPSTPLRSTPGVRASPSRAHPDIFKITNDGTRHASTTRPERPSPRPPRRSGLDHPDRPRPERRRPRLPPRPAEAPRPALVERRMEPRPGQRVGQGRRGAGRRALRADPGPRRGARRPGHPAPRACAHARRAGPLDQRLPPSPLAHAR
jgi:hypothetical protein